MSLNRKVSANNKYGSGLCGVNAKNYDTFLDKWISEATYRAGDTIEITSHLTAYHGGHIEIGACADDEPTQECFSSNKLKYKGGGHPRDSAYKERAYLGTTSDQGTGAYTHRFRLPDNIVGKRVLLQWRYFTANSCQPEGYRDYFDSVGWNYGSTGMCNKDTYDDRGSTVPERFWNCIEVSILPSSGEGEDDTGDSGEQDEDNNANPPLRGVKNPKNPISIQLGATDPDKSDDKKSHCQAETNTCGPDNQCEDGSCCSQWGWCGSTAAHCGECCQSNCWSS